MGNIPNAKSKTKLSGFKRFHIHWETTTKTKTQSNVYWKFGFFWGVMPCFQLRKKKTVKRTEVGSVARPQSHICSYTTDWTKWLPKGFSFCSLGRKPKNGWKSKNLETLIKKGEALFFTRVHCRQVAAVKEVVRLVDREKWQRGLMIGRVRFTLFCFQCNCKAAPSHLLGFVVHKQF